MAAGLPVVCTKVGAVPEVVEDGVNGYLVDPGRVEELAEAIAKLGSDYELRLRMGETNREKVATHFDVDAIAAGMCAIFNGVVSDPEKGCLPA